MAASNNGSGRVEACRSRVRSAAARRAGSGGLRGFEQRAVAEIEQRRAARLSGLALGLRQRIHASVRRQYDSAIGITCQLAVDQGCRERVGPAAVSRRCLCRKPDQRAPGVAHCGAIAADFADQICAVVRGMRG
jgi:hypothetical protein